MLVHTYPISLDQACGPDGLIREDELTIPPRRYFGLWPVAAADEYILYGAGIVRGVHA